MATNVEAGALGSAADVDGIVEELVVVVLPSGPVVVVLPSGPVVVVVVVEEVDEVDVDVGPPG